MKISYPGFIGGLICVGIACALLAATWWSYADYKRLEAYDGHTTAYIVKKYSRPAAGGKVQYFLDYTFAPAGGKINVRTSVSKERWDAFQEKDTLPIRYDLSKPDRHIPIYEPGSSLAFAFFMLLLGAAFLVFGGSRLYFSVQKSGRKRV